MTKAAKGLARRPSRWPSRGLSRSQALGLALGLALALAIGCARSLPRAAMPAVPPGKVIPEIRPPRGSAALSLTIRWPARTGDRRSHAPGAVRTAQAIPESADSLAFSVYRFGQTEKAFQTAIARPQDGSPTSRVELSPLPPVDAVVSAVALDAAGDPVAAGAAHVELEPNVRATASITLGPLAMPSVTGFHPRTPLPGTRMAIFGSGFGALGDPPAVTIGGTPVASGAAVRVQPGFLYAEVPVDAGMGPVVVGGATSSATVSTIRSLSLEASGSTDVFLRGRRELLAKARGADGEELDVEPDDLPWTVTSEACFDCAEYPPAEEEAGEGGGGEGQEEEEEEEEEGAEIKPHSFAEVEDGVFVAGENRQRVRVRVGNEIVGADLVLTTRDIVPPDLPPGMGPLGAVPIPEGDPVTAARAALGRNLFFETRLSRTGRMSCATCHDPARDWTDGRPVAIGSDDQPLSRHSPTILNAAYFGSLFWDGRAPSLEDQARAVMLNPRELGTDFAAFLAFLAGSEPYKASFAAAYEKVPANRDDVLELVPRAIAAFERTQTTGPSAFDRWASGETGALSRDARIGLGTFIGAARCAACHSGSLFSDGKFHNIGVPGSGSDDLGREAFTSSRADRGAFKTPTLRNIARTGPYFHDGSRRTLGDAIRHYEDVDPQFPDLDPLLEPRAVDGLSDNLFLQAFLRALTGATPSLTAR